MTALLTQFQQNGNLIFLAMVFVSVVLFTVGVATLTSSWLGVRRRAVAEFGNSVLPEFSAGSDGSLLHADDKAGLEFLLPGNAAEKSELRRFLNLAGYYGRGTPVLYQLIRIGLALAFGMITPFVYRTLYPNHPFFFVIAACLVMALLGYMLPRTVVSLRRDKLCEEHRQGFPDFLDLLVICVEAGIGVDSAIERISKDLGYGYPSLARNLKFMSMELRAGRSTRDALESLSDRLGIPEAKSFATLIHQSEELGSSLVQSLRVYSEEMRQKRFSRAEEKAHALPVKLVIPLGLFIFPVVLGVTLFPIALKVYKAFGIS
jgi:tight adherence protein C